MYDSVSSFRKERIGLIKIGPATLGGPTKVCVPLVGRSLEALLEECAFLANVKADVVELRIDFLGESYDKALVLEAVEKVRAALPNRGLLFTWRTKQEGGEKEISVEDYFDLLESVIPTGHVDAIDIEYFFDQERMGQTVDLAKKHGVTVVMSNHDFHKTPAQEEIESRLSGMKEAGAHIAKLACMPQSPDDVLIVLTATNHVRKQYPDEPIITMAMGQLGVVTRICGNVFGNALSFGAAKQASAPGQVEVELLNQILERVNQ